MNGAEQRPKGAETDLSGTRPDTRSMTRIADARERFAAGADSVDGVRPEVLMSWYRCREQYQVDPCRDQAPSASEPRWHPLAHDIVFAELGGHAATASRQIGDNGLVAVTDPDGRILSAWGNRRIQTIAADHNMTPWASWSEPASGTNGMGSALHNHEPVLVRGPEHWCQGFHGWECAGVAIRDVVTDQPLAVLDMSTWQSALPDTVVPWLRSIAAATEAKLHHQAQRHGSLLAGAFTASRVPATTPLAVVDLAGKVVHANDNAAAYLNTPKQTSPAHAPTRRWAPQLPTLSQLVARAAECANTDRHWSGTTHIFVPFLNITAAVGMQPVFTGTQLIGMLLAFSSSDTEPAIGHPDATAFPETRPDPPPAPTVPTRVVASYEDRWLLLDPREIRYAQADHNTVWLATTTATCRRPAADSTSSNINSPTKASSAPTAATSPTSPASAKSNPASKADSSWPPTRADMKPSPSPAGTPHRSGNSSDYDHRFIASRPRVAVHPDRDNQPAGCRIAGRATSNVCVARHATP